MLTRRNFTTGAISVGAAAMTIVPAAAREAKRFEKAAFAAAQASGAPILIEVTAPWCPTCKVQAPIIKSVAEKPEFAKLVIFEIDFDSRKDILREFNVRQQSTLILFKGRTETGRSTGDTNSASVEALMRSAI